MKSNLEIAERVVTDVIAERGKQDDRWGIQNHSPEYWLAILMEEVGELSRAFLELNLSAYRKETIHVAAVAMAMVECYDRRERK